MRTGGTPSSPALIASTLAPKLDESPAQHASPIHKPPVAVPSILARVVTDLSSSSATSDPRFFCFPSHQSFHQQLMENTPARMRAETEKYVSKRQFWKLRYLFILVHFVPTHQRDAHVALCAISPEAKTVDYVCSGGDT